MKYRAGAIICLAVLCLHALQQAAVVAKQQQAMVPGPSGDKVVVHLFEWSWKDIERECESLGKWGYWGVQVSPPQEDVAGTEEWWARYQPVSYKLCSRSGNEQEFSSMVKTCKSHGVSIIVDAVINHMARHGEGKGRCGSVMHSKCSYDGGYQCMDFHQLGCPGESCGEHCEDCMNCESLACQGSNPDHVYTCNLLSLPDLNTSREGVQVRIAGYFNHLVDLGVAGVRIDAAKHIKPSELSAILGKVKAPGLYVSQETMFEGDCECVSRDDYTMNGKLWEFNVPSLFNDIFKRQDLNDMGKIQEMDSNNPGGTCGWTQSELAHTFVVNHDRLLNPEYRLDTVTIFDEGIYRLALITLLSHPYGQPSILSSINFDYNAWDQKAPSTSVFPDGCGYWKDRPMKPYACEHRWPEVRNMVAWRATAGTSGAVPMFHAQGDIFAMTRGEDNDTGKAFLAVNRGGGSFAYTFDAKMPPGQYCNVVAQGSGVEDCYPCQPTCPYQVTVGGDGGVHVDLGPRQAVAFHTGSKLPSPSSNLSTNPSIDPASDISGDPFANPAGNTSSNTSSNLYDNPITNPSSLASSNSSGSPYSHPSSNLSSKHGHGKMREDPNAAVD